MNLYPIKFFNQNYQFFNQPYFPTYKYGCSNFSCPIYRYSDQNNFLNQSMITNPMIILSNTFHSLWEQHSAWTRMTIMSIVFDLPDADVVTKRLLQNPVDFGNVLSIFYGNETATKFSELLKEHLVIASDLVKSSKTGDTKAAKAYEIKWYDNADQIAALLASINPYWSEEEWKRMLHEHLRLVKSEAVSMLTKNYSESVNIYDEIEIQALEMADTMVQGIITQFPDRFLK